MKLYEREEELELLERTRKIAFSDHSQMTVLTGYVEITSKNNKREIHRGLPFIV